ncbi:hypothetical protein ACP70R_004539 [Stipagrostis hirtigluma subsp. patula]
MSCQWDKPASASNTEGFTLNGNGGINILEDIRCYWQ